MESHKGSLLTRDLQMSSYSEFEVSLEEITPRIWRRFLLRDNATFHELHDTLQKACGWENCHLYQFLEIHSSKCLAESPYCEDSGNSCPSAGEVKISSFFHKAGDSCIYEYDFGDCWRHVVKLNSIASLPGQFRRKLVGGERAFPPEDCGGIMGYEESVEALLISDSKLKDMDEYAKDELLSRREWLGDWHPEHFDFEATAKRLKRPVQ